MNITKIDETNYQSYTRLPIVAFSFARGGAMGDPGGIEIIDCEGQLYYANYVYGRQCLDPSHIKEIIPVFSNLNFSLVHCQSGDADWEVVDLGYGNYLVLKSEFSDRFHKAVDKANLHAVGQLYQHWQGIVLRLLGKDECEE